MCWQSQEGTVPKEDLGAGELARHYFCHRANRWEGFLWLSSEAVTNR